MITDEQIREMQWQSGICRLKKGCQDLLDEIERAEKCVEDLLDILNR